MEGQYLKSLARSIANDKIFKYSIIDDILIEIQELSFCRNVDMNEFRILLNVEQRRKKLEKINEKN